MGTKTGTRLAILFVVIAAMAAGGYFLREFRVRRMAQGVVALADRAVEEGDLGKAMELYTQHLAVMPDDVEVRLKYADVILKADRSQKRQLDALEIYEGTLRQFPGRADVRRRAAEVAAEIGGGWFEKARNHLDNLLKTAKDDGHLEYLMARCQEHDKEFVLAEKYYKLAAEHGAPERLEASERRAILLRDNLGQGEEADKAIDAMVKSAPDDYRVYLARGLYRNGDRRGGGRGGDDLRKALQLAPDRPEVYLQVARAVERESGLDAARQILDKGLAAAPKAVDLYVALAGLEQRAGRGDRAADALELGLKVMPDEINLRGQLALLLANRGDTGRLLLQVAELERAGASRFFTQYLRACYYFNNHEFFKARQILAPLQPDVAGIPTLKSLVNMLLAKCYSELSEPELQREATLRALSVDPNNMTARLGWIQGLIERGDLEAALREYRGLYADQPGVIRLPLAALLIEQNRRLSPAQRQWAEVERLIKEAADAAPGAAEPAILRAQLLLEQGQEEKALDALATARGKFPKNPGPWIAEADLLTRLKKYDQAQGVLDGARAQLGDRADLRLARLRLAANRGGPQLVPALNEMARGIEPFSPEDRRRLLTALATELGRQQDLVGASKAWSRLVELEPERLQPRFQLFELALQSKDQELAKAQIRAIANLDEHFGQFCQAQFLAWQARGSADAAEKAKMRGEARVLLTALKSRRPDWSRVPLALARLDEQELEDAGPDEALRRDKLEAAIGAYRRAIELGWRDASVVRHVVELLFRAGRGNEALDVYGQVPTAVQLTGDLGRMASQIALANRDFRQAEEIARKAVEVSPQDFQARVWLAQVLLEGRNTEGAEAEILKAIAAAKADPERWLTLVRFAVLTRQSDKAEKAVRDAEANLGKSPLALAQCCQMLGSAYAAADADRSKSWYDRASRWFDKAQEDLKDPNDLTVKRRFTEFLLQANRAAEAEEALKEILARTADGKSPDLRTWARRSLAQVYAVASPPRIADALALFAGKEGGGGPEADDLRVIALIHEAQGTPEGRRQAIGDLEALIGRESAAPEDRRRLAQLLESVGEWTGAREQFRELILRTDAARDADTISRRPRYLALFVEALIKHHRAGDDSDLAEARQLVGKLRSTQVDALLVVLLEAEIDKAAKRPDAADARIRDFAGRPGLTVVARLRLANEAERLGLLGAAESILRGIAAQPPADPNRFQLAVFLARHGRVKDAIDICESMRGDAALRDRAATLAVQIVSDTAIPLDEAQARRVLAWLEKALAEGPSPSMLYLLGLGNVNDRLEYYGRAEEFYRAAIKLNDRDGVASNNLAWLYTLKGGKGDEALALINNAIRLKGEVPEYLDTRGMTYLTVGDKQRAIVDLEKALKASPSGPKCFHLARAYLEANEPDKARKILEAGKSRGLPGGLHPLELAAYNQVADRLGKP